MNNLPTILLIDPKYERNVGMVVRAAVAMGAREVLVCGRRWSSDGRCVSKKGKRRKPRELRMFGGKMREVSTSLDVLNQYDQLVVFERDNRGQNLAAHNYERSGNKPLYIFGPEDGAVPSRVMRRCDLVLTIPCGDSINLACAVHIALWDRTRAGVAATS